MMNLIINIGSIGNLVTNLIVIAPSKNNDSKEKMNGKFYLNGFLHIAVCLCNEFLMQSGNK